MKVSASGFTVTGALDPVQAEFIRDLALSAAGLLNPKIGGESVLPYQPSGLWEELMSREDNDSFTAQKYVQEITAGDKRILLVDGEPVPYALARIPSPTDNRGNLAAGAKGVGRPLNDRDRWLVSQIGPVLRERGMLTSGELARRFGVCPTTVNHLGRQGILKRHMYDSDHRYLYEPPGEPADAIGHLDQLEHARARHRGRKVLGQRQQAAIQRRRAAAKRDHRRDRRGHQHRRRQRQQHHDRHPEPPVVRRR